MRFVKTTNHTFEITNKSCTYGTEINMDEHKERNEKSNYYVNKVVDFQATTAHNLG